MAKRLDNMARDQGFAGDAAHVWIELYQIESVMAHPRLQALLAECFSGRPALATQRSLY